MRSRHPVLLAVFTCLLPLLAQDVDGPKYGSNFWQEYHNDSRTVLLFHFGKPQPSPWDKLVEAGLSQREKKKDEKNFGKDLLEEDLSGEDADLLDLGNEVLEAHKKAEKNKGYLPPVKEAAVPTKEVLDYGPYRAKMKLAGGVKVVPKSKFGAGLKFDGTGPGMKLSLRSLDPENRKGVPLTMVECWFKVDALPKQPVCIASTGDDNARILLHPDGIIEFWRKNPHGQPQKGHFQRFATLDEYNLIFDAPTDIKSTTRVRPGQWTHVAVSRGQAAQIEAQVAFLFVNGLEEAKFQYSRWNWHNLFVAGNQTLTLGNSFDGKQPFCGELDELRVSRGNIYFGLPSRYFNRPKTYGWLDKTASRQPRFDKPYFLENGSVFHLSFDKGLAYDFHKAGAASPTFDRKVKKPTAFLTAGIRGKGFAIDPRVGLLRIPFKGLSFRGGTLEFWAKPLNWDNAASFPILRILCESENKEEQEFLAYIHVGPGGLRDGESPTFHPGVWNHFCITWDKDEKHRFRVYKNHKNRWRRAGMVRPKDRAITSRHPASFKPVFLEFGVAGERKAGDGREPMIVIDEVAAHNYAFIPNEARQAYYRVQQDIEPIKLFDLRPDYKYSIAELSAKFETLLPRGVTADQVTVEAVDVKGNTVGKPITKPLKDGKADILFAAGRPLPSGLVTFKVKAVDAAGKVVINDTHTGWGYIRRPWRNNKIGVPKTAPQPWTPIVVKGKRLETRMIRYELADGALPAKVIAKGKDLLARPMRLLENGVPMKAGELKIGASKDVEANWSSTYTGKTCSVDVQCRLEFDGLIRFELTIKPKGKVGRITCEIPLQAEYATRRVWQSCAFWGLMQASKDTPTVFSTRHEILGRVQKRWQRNRRRQGKKPTIATMKAYNFWSQMDLNNLERGIYWFADNAAGWHQSESVPAQEFRKSGREHSIVCNLVAEPVTYKSGRPIVFGILPHPARPLPSDYRYIAAGPSPQDKRAGTVYASTFYPWPSPPTAGNMKVYPAKGDWDYAQSLIPQMKSICKGYRTLYQSIGYMSCRAGSYDGWEWRNANGSRISLTKSFVEYATWEMEQWIKRGIFDAIYLDDSYAVVCNNANAVKAGQAIVLPNGKVQGGHRIWMFRELMKRWRQLFLEKGIRPMLISHHSGHWVYPGMVFCETTLDGEGQPTITLGGRRDFMEALNQTRFEVLSNPHLWGVSRTFMPGIWQKGPLNKGAGNAAPWKWRMARSAQAMLAHMENPFTFVDEGNAVFNAYWKDILGWGAGKAHVQFIPYYQADSVLSVDGQSEKVLVSVYKDKGRALLIVTNKVKKDRKIPMTLDLTKLGLKGKPSVKALDGCYDAPAGMDPWLMKKTLPKKPEKDADTLLDDVADDLDDIQLEDEEEKKAKRKKAEKPTIAGNVITVPVRSHDYRIIAVE